MLAQRPKAELESPMRVCKEIYRFLALFPAGDSESVEAGQDSAIPCFQLVLLSVSNPHPGLGTNEERAMFEIREIDYEGGG